MPADFWLGGDSGNEKDWDTAANWDSNSVPVNGDEVRIGPRKGTGLTTYGITGIDKSAVTHAGVYVMEGYDKEIGSEDAYMQIGLSASNRLEFNGSGTSYFDIGSTNEDIVVLGTKTTGLSTGTHGLYLKGSDIDDLDISGGNVGLAALPTETSTVDDCRVSGSSTSVEFGPGVTVTTSIRLTDGTFRLDANTYGGSCTIHVDGGTMTISTTSTIPTLNVDFNGTVVLLEGTITTCNMDHADCELDLTQGRAKTVTTLNHNAGLLKVDSKATITTYNEASESQIQVDPLQG